MSRDVEKLAVLVMGFIVGLVLITLLACGSPTAPDCTNGTLVTTTDARTAALDATTEGCAYWTVHTPKGLVYVTVECIDGVCAAWQTWRPIG